MQYLIKMRRFLLSIIPLTFLLPKKAFAQGNPEKDILSNTIKIYSSISTNIEIKTRIKKQELSIRKWMNYWINKIIISFYIIKSQNYNIKKENDII